MSEENKTNLNVSAGPEPAPAVDQTTLNQDPYAAVCLPENTSLQAEDLAALKQTAAKEKWPVETLQQCLCALEASLQAYVSKQASQHQQQQEKWVCQVQEEFGPDWQTEVSCAVRAADMFGGPELRQLLEETGLGNHPVIVRTFQAVARCISEDITPGGSTAVAEDKTFAQALYGKN